MKIEIQTHTHREMVDITRRVVEAAGGAADGMIHVYVPHTTAAVVINENADPDVTSDLITAYEAMVPSVHFNHAEGNSDAHFLATLLGSSVSIPVSNGRPDLGTWQGIFFVELDGPRRRKVLINRS